MMIRVLLFVLPFVSHFGVQVIGSAANDPCSDIFEGSCLKGTKFADEYQKAQERCKCYGGSQKNINFIKDSSNQKHDVCLTNNGVPCAFPFTYKGKKYEKCTDEDLGGIFWCKTGDGLWDYGACNTTMHSCMESYGGGCPSKNPTAKCYFPFKYKDKVYNGCTRLDFGGNRWCGTAPEVDILNWAECEPECPDDDSQSEYCIYKELGWVENDAVSRNKVKRSIDLLFEQNTKTKQIMIIAFQRCFMEKTHVPLINGYLHGIQNKDKLGCLKLVSNFLCDRSARYH